MSRIDQIKNAAAVGAVAPQDRKTQGSAAQGTAGKPAPEASAQVAISSAGSALSEASQDPSFDSAKVEALAQAIKDGKFTVDPHAIADKLISNAQELLGRGNTSH